jgi:hypothetical protein
MDTNIPSLYQIKYRLNNNGKWRYGIVERFDEEAKKQWEARRLLLVSDAIIPIAYWVEYDNSEIVEVPSDEFYNYLQNQHQKAIEKSDKSNTLKNKMFSIGVGDGYAYYVVVKENKKTAKIEWRGFCPDRWCDAFLGYGGTFDKKRIANLVQATEGIRSLFSKSI